MPDIKDDIRLAVTRFTEAVAANIHSPEPKAIAHSELREVALTALKNQGADYTPEDMDLSDPSSTIIRLGSAIFYECADVVKSDNPQASELAKQYFRRAHFAVINAITSDIQPKSLTWTIIRTANKALAAKPPLPPQR